MVGPDLIERVVDTVYTQGSRLLDEFADWLTDKDAQTYWLHPRVVKNQYMKLPGGILCLEGSGTMRKHSFQPREKEALNRMWLVILIGSFNFKNSNFYRNTEQV